MIADGAKKHSPWRETRVSLVWMVDFLRLSFFHSQFPRDDMRTTQRPRTGSLRPRASSGRVRRHPPLHNRVVCALIFIGLGAALFTSRPLAGQESTTTQGADDAFAHWSHTPIRSLANLDSSNAASWAANEIDVLLQDTFKDSIPQRASSHQLARRLSLTITGLPPLDVLRPERPLRSSTDVHRYIERLLASPRFGEHAAVAWLDLARYADTHGYHIDAHRDMWRWRDWVIEAFNQNMPFDRFTLLQLAGDQVAPAATRFETMKQHLATGFLRNTPIQSEDGAIAEEFLAEYAAERTIAIGAAWLGQTLQCCRCHDHTNDPWTQADFYSLSAFFNDLPEKGIAGLRGNAAPEMPAPTLVQEARWQRLLEQKKRLQNQLDILLHVQDADRHREQQRWEKSVRKEGRLPGPTDFASQLQASETPNTKLKPSSAQLIGEDVRIAVTPPALEVSHETTEPAPSGPAAIAMRGVQHIDWTAPLGETFTFTCWMQPANGDSMTLLAMRPRPAKTAELEASAQAPLQLQNRDGMLRLVADEVELASAKLPADIRPRKWLQVAWTCSDGLHKIYVNGQFVLQHLTARDASGDAKPVNRPVQLFIGGVPAPSRDGEGANDEVDVAIGRGAKTGFRGLVHECLVFQRRLSAIELDRLAHVNPLMPTLAKPDTSRTAAEKRRVREAFLFATSPRFIKHRRQLDELIEDLDRMKAAFPRSMVMAVGPVRPTHLLKRGDYRHKGRQVSRATPDWLPPLPTPKGETPTRQDLARWLTSPNHPLTARVVVNRIWQQHFVAGLINTPTDLGLATSQPDHLALLDYLARKLIDSGWDQKHIHRLILRSAVYQRDALLVNDPSLCPKTLGRTPQAAEVVRDSALAAARLLTSPIGGPSVFPYQPEGLWDELTRNPNLYSAQRYRQDQGEGLYRRSVYTFWKRSIPPPTLQLLGAPRRETCVALRQPPMGPQRALTLLNDPVFIESARRVGAQCLDASNPIEQGLGDRQRKQRGIECGFRRVLQRPPTAAERQTMLAAIDKLLEHYRQRPDDARKLLTVGESAPNPKHDATALAAWTAWCNVLMNSREFLAP